MNDINDLDQPQDVFIPPEDRTQHIYVAGKSRQGKSNLLFWQAYQDMYDGHGVAVVDPHGDLVEDLMNHIPPHRLDDVVYLNGLNKIPIEFLKWRSGAADGGEAEKEGLVSDLVEILRRLDPTWGVRMDAIFQWTALTVLSAEHATFLDIHEILADERYRDKFLNRVSNQRIHDWWKIQFPKLGKNVETPITTRMTTFLLNPSLSAIFSEPNPKLAITDVTEKGLILLVNLAELADISNNIFGSLVISKLKQAITRRASIKKANRRSFYFYVDEFQEFITTGFQSVLRRAGKSGFGLTLANHYPEQLGPDLMKDVIGTVSSYVLFKMNADEARPLASEILPYQTSILTGFPKGTALYRPCSGPPHIVDTQPPPGPPTEVELKNAEYIRQHTVEKYGARSAQTVQKRPVDSAPSQPASEPLRLRDDDEIKPSGRPKIVPPHRS